MLKKIAAMLAIALGAVLLYATTRPDSFRVEREVTIQAPPEKIFPFLADFHRWGDWSPWEKLDPAMKRTHGGAASGKGAVYQWEGNGEVGNGRMEIVEVTEPGKVVIQLEFTEPMEARNTAEFVLTPGNGGTRVQWAMHGPSPYLAKVMGVLVSMDKMIGKDFEIGLSNLKAAAER
ncbi:SRPBCC family protein [Tahibacter amnicola]|uniref:SRPBCC family protein n=1 Tax=Tahibacter amnicola TaxID=2976241 RepID=A0ABY6BIA8_9GAMM|nr:SRPBCC family protein [Tahibacter amnicola]UXI68825.1 SRPBCC family protein [Tahibacter amnicola]